MNRQNPIFYQLLILLAFLLVVLAFVGCKTLPAPVPGASHDHSRDSISTEYVRDTIKTDRWHTVYVKGNTIIIHDSIDRWHIRHDSIDRYVYINNTDTIYEPVETEKPQSAFLTNSGIALWVLIGIAIVAAIIGIALRFARR